MLGETCDPCPCHGNLDTSSPGSCDQVTGECLRCNEKTEGEFCEKCRPGYFGNAEKSNCTGNTFYPFPMKRVRLIILSVHSKMDKLNLRSRKLSFSQELYPSFQTIYFLYFRMWLQ